jgi:outer membrane protein assembly factor BamB
MKGRILTALLGLTAASTAPVGGQPPPKPPAAADWAQFRGSDGSGVSTEAKLPTEWAADKNVAWKVSVPGVAWSCPIVVGDRVFVTTAVADGQPKPGGGFGGGRPGGGGGPPGGGRPGGGGGRGAGGPDKVYTWKVVCLDKATGKELWAKPAADGKPKYGTHGSNTFASETPVSDGERVYSYFAASGIVIAHDLAGKEIWKKEIGAFPAQNNWGTSSSPAVYDGVLFIQCDNEEKSFLLALDARTGEQKWKVDRQERTNWSTPYLWKTKDRTDLVVGGSGRVRGYNPADGKVIWELAIGGGQSNATPVGDAERLYFGTGGMGGGRPGGFGGGGGRPGGGAGGPGGGGAGAGTLFAIKAGATGDITPKAGEKSSDGMAWAAKGAAPGAASPLVLDGHVYTLDRQGGQVTCLDAKTGEQKYKERIPNAGAFWASPWAYDGKVFCLDETGTTHVLKAGPTFEVLRKNTLGKDVYWSSPAVAGGSVFLRGVDSLVCVR